MSSQLHKGFSRRQVLGGAAGGGLALLTGRTLAGATFDPDEGTPTGTIESAEQGEAVSPTGESITLYNGQHRMAEAMCAAFTRATGIAVEQRSGEGAELAAQIAAEGSGSPADIIITENSPNLVFLSEKDLLAPVDAETLEKVDSKYNSEKGDWVGIAARAAVLVYNPELLPEAELPKSIMELSDPKWDGKVGIAPAEGDFQPVITAVIKIEGEDKANDWADGLAKNAKTYQSNSPILKAVEDGEIASGIINHYYWFRTAESNGGPSAMKSKLYYFGNEDPGAVVVVSPAGIIKSSKKIDLAQQFLAFAVSEAGQQVLLDIEDYEYPLGSGVAADPELKPLDELGAPDLSPADLGDGTEAIELLQEVGLI